MMKTKKLSKSLALVLAAVLALTPMAGFPITALATDEAATPKAEAPAATQTPAADADDTLQADAPAATTPAVDAETPQAEAPATDATQPAAPAPTTSAAIALTAPAAAVESAAASEGDVVINEINFPDENFRKCIEEKGYDTNADGTLQAAELEKVTEFGMGLDNPSDAEQAIKDLTGIKLFTSLQSFNAGRFWALEVLDLSGSKTLKTFFAGQLKHINLANCVNLDNFQLAGYYETEYIDLSGCTSLAEFWSCDYAEKLTHLDLSNCSSLTKLQLYAYFYPASEGILYFDISGCTKLDFLDYHTPTTAVPIGLAECKNLTNLRYMEGPIEKLDLSPFPLLTELDITGTDIESIDLAPVKNLTSFTSRYGKLKTLDFSPCPQLEQVMCNSNQLTSLNVSKNKGLVRLECYRNNLTVLDASSIKNLGSLWCYDNNLTTLNLPAINTDIDLWCYDNNLTTLNLKDYSELSSGSRLSPQRSDFVIPVVKRDAYEVDATALLGLPEAAIDGQPLAASGEAKLSIPPRLATYTFEVDAPSLNDTRKTVTVEARNFQVRQVVTAETDGNGSISWEGRAPVNKEFLVPEKSTPTFTATPKSGYQIATLKVGRDDIKVNEDATSQTLTLPPVTDAVTIAATFKKLPTANITASADDNGTIDPVGVVEVTKGTDKTFTFTPKTGSELASVLVDDVEVPSDQLKGNTYTFTNVTAPHTIAATFTTPVDPVDPVDPPKPPVNPADPINPPTPPAVPDNGGNNNGGNGNGATTVVERTNTVVVPAAPQAAALAAPETPATLAAPATAAAKTQAAPAKATADTAAPQGQLENPALGAQALDTQHSHLPLALLLLAVWLVGGFVVIRQRKHTHDAIDGASY
ncbi:MAG: hypothetical protein RSA89_04150 [Raoultibacter sp.]